MVCETVQCFITLILLSIVPLDNIGATPKDYQEVGLKIHNDYRAMHNTGPLKLDPMLNDMADKCAQYYISIDYIDHSCKFKETNKYPPFDRAGENLYWRVESDVSAASAVKEAIKVWYAEIMDYDFEKNLPKPHKEFADIGHFTQTVWKNSKALGIGFAAIKGNGICVVGLYGPHGNVVGKTKDNVLPRSNRNASDKGEEDDAGESIGGRGRSLTVSKDKDGKSSSKACRIGKTRTNTVLSVAMYFGLVYRKTCSFL